jgi:hypothetical protein
MIVVAIAMGAREVLSYSMLLLATTTVLLILSSDVVWILVRRGDGFD